MTLDEYVEYKAEKERRFWKSIRSKGSPKRDEVLVYSDSDEEDEEYYRLSHPSHTPNTPLDKKDSGLDDLFRIRAENLKRMEQEKVQNGCDDDISRDTNHESDNINVWEKDEAQVEDCDKGDIYEI
ncbi:hypothetical protein Tco_1435637 [Tanacetum coccineum]